VVDPLRDNAFGYDVSHWQDATPSLAGLDFLIARATIGTTPDEMYPIHRANARKDGIFFGAYHFGDSGTTAAAQVAAFLKVAGDADFYVLDHEGNREMTSAQAKAFIAGVQAAKGRAGLYHSLSGFPDFGQDFNWIALWASTPPASLPWTFWQFGGSPLDHDVFNGSPAELRAFVGGDMAPAPITDETPKMVSKADGTPWYDLDGTTVIVSSPGPLSARLSPYGVGNKRAIYGTTGGVHRVVLITPSSVAAIPPVTIDATQSEIDAAKAAQKAIDDAACAVTVKAAIATERSRIWLVFKNLLGI
jgi:hypothetical protein